MEDETFGFEEYRIEGSLDVVRASKDCGISGAIYNGAKAFEVAVAWVCCIPRQLVQPLNCIVK